MVVHICNLNLPYITGRLRQRDHKLEANLVYIVRKEIYFDTARIALLFSATKGSD